MATTVTKSIGSGGGRDYSTLQAWEDALPADLVSGDTIQIGECYNDSEFFATSGPLVTIDGVTTDSGHTITLTAAAGHSFQDHASVRTNALTYNQTNGVGLRIGSGSYIGPCVSVRTEWTTVKRLQLKNQSDNDAAAAFGFGTNGQCLENCIVEANTTGNGAAVTGMWGTSYNSKITNCVIVQARASAGHGVEIFGTIIEHTLIIRPSDKTASGSGVRVSSGYTNAVRLKNSAIFGFSSIAPASSFDASGNSNNATNLASGLPGTSNQHSITYSSTSPFTSAAYATLDTRLANDGNALINNGVYNASYPNDISLTARNNPPEIGAWELASVAPPSDLTRSPTGVAYGGISY